MPSHLEADIREHMNAMVEKPPAGFLTMKQLCQENDCSDPTMRRRLYVLLGSGAWETVMVRKLTASGVRGVPHYGRTRKIYRKQNKPT